MKLEWLAESLGGTLGVEEAYIIHRKQTYTLDEPPLPDFADTKEIQRERTPPLNNPRLLFYLNLSTVTYGARTEPRSVGCFYDKS